MIYISKLFALIFILSFFFGCVTPPAPFSTYEPPIFRELKQNIFISKSFPLVWNKVEEAITESIYVIDEIDKESRFIDVSFSTYYPELYIDCGKILRTNPKTAEEIIEGYEVASSNSIQQNISLDAPKAFHETRNINRKTSLDGKVRIKIIPLNHGTEVSIECQYSLKIVTQGRYETKDSSGIQMEQGALPTKRTSHLFSTSRDIPFFIDLPDEIIEAHCLSTGKLETDIFEFIQN